MQSMIHKPSYPWTSLWDRFGCYGKTMMNTQLAYDNLRLSILQSQNGGRASADFRSFMVQALQQIGQPI